MSKRVLSKLTKFVIITIYVCILFHERISKLNHNIYLRKVNNGQLDIDMSFPPCRFSLFFLPDEESESCQGISGLEKINQINQCFMNWTQCYPKTIFACMIKLRWYFTLIVFIWIQGWRLVKRWKYGMEFL